MKTTCSPAGMPAGQPFASRDQMLLWEAGIDLGSQQFENEAEAVAAAKAVLALHPELSYQLEG
jgi:hypothetical protein